jgi:hypothetical protein
MAAKSGEPVSTSEAAKQLLDEVKKQKARVALNRLKDHEAWR